MAITIPNLNFQLNKPQHILLKPIFKRISFVRSQFHRQSATCAIIIIETGGTTHNNKRCKAPWGTSNYTGITYLHVTTDINSY